MTFWGVEWDGSSLIIHGLIYTLTELLTLRYGRSDCRARTACCALYCCASWIQYHFSDRKNSGIDCGLAFSVLAIDYRYVSEIFIELEL